MNHLHLPLALWRTAPLVHPDPGVGDVLARLKYCARGLLRPGLTRAWFALLEDPALVAARSRHPRILSKLQRPYLHRRLDARGRFEALRQHYRFVRERFIPAEMETIHNAPGLLLARAPDANAQRVAVRLSYMDQYEKEGDLSLSLRDEGTGELLFVLTFCVHVFHAGAGEMFIGGLQGQAAANDRERIVELTRKWHGLRPKALLVFAVQQLAQLWNCPVLLAVGDSEHIYRHAHRRRDIRASYDEFWRECGGVPTAEGNFSLPTMPAERDLAELPTNKRPVYRRRYAMLREIAAEIRASLRVTALPEPQPAAP